MQGFQEKKKSYMNGSVCATVPEDFRFEFGCTCPIHIDKHLEPLNVLHFRALLQEELGEGGGIWGQWGLGRGGGQVKREG